jgi:hypothetical protein
VRTAIVAERLQCKPIHGHDLPLSALQGSQNAQNAVLLEVEHLDHVESEPIKAPPVLDDDQKILSMLLPQSLKQPEMVFIEEEDLDSQTFEKK